MSKKYGLDGLYDSVELGLGGVRVKNAAGQLEVRNNADSALVKLKAADGTASDDVVTKNQLDNVTVAGTVNYRTLALAYNSSGTENIGAAVTGTAAFRFWVSVTTAFDGTAPTLQIGKATAEGAIADVADVDLTATGIYSGEGHLDIGTSTQMIATYVADSSTAGEATIIVEWI